MNSIDTFLSEGPRAINVGLEMFASDLAEQGVPVACVEWSPPGGGNPRVLHALDTLDSPGTAALVDAANQTVIQRVFDARPTLVGFDKAINVIPGMTRTTILHAGPPIAWQQMAGAMRGAVVGALLFEGLAADLVEAAELAASGEITFAPCHDHGCVGSMAGVTSGSMYVHVVENKTHGNVAYTNLSEQMVKILRMGANDDSVIARLAWMRDVLGPLLQEAMERAGEIDLRLLAAQALHMGDELHNRNNAGTCLLMQALTPHILRTSFTTREQIEVFEFVASSDYFSGPTWMATCKAAMDAGRGIPHSSIVTAMTRNGVEFGIRVSGTGDAWFTGPAQEVIGPLFAGYRRQDAGLDIGDSAITEAYGLGGFALAAAPAVVGLVGGRVDEALDISGAMREVTTAENPNVTIPALGFRGVATGIDVRRVVESGILPVITTAIAHKDAGVGMIGAGITSPPMECFVSALIALAQTDVAPAQ